MQIGTSIRLIRIAKKISQKELAEACKLSSNALGLIEKNVSFPKKSTLDRICDYLAVKQSYVLFFAITEEDIPEEKRMAFNALQSVMKQLLLF